jgi:hypothetical protein
VSSPDQTVEAIKRAYIAGGIEALTRPLVTPSSHLEPPDPVYCELCDEYDDDCTCEVGYQEERDDD